MTSSLSSPASGDAGAPGTETGWPPSRPAPPPRHPAGHRAGARSTAARARGDGRAVVALHRAAHLLIPFPRAAPARARDAGAPGHMAPAPWLYVAMPPVRRGGRPTTDLASRYTSCCRAAANSCRSDPTLSLVEILRRDGRGAHRACASGCTKSPPPNRCTPNDWFDTTVYGPRTRVEAFDIPASGHADNEARDQVWRRWCSPIIVDQLLDDVRMRVRLPRTELRRSLLENLERSTGRVSRALDADPGGHTGGPWSAARPAAARTLAEPRTYGSCSARTPGGPDRAGPATAGRLRPRLGDPRMSRLDCRRSGGRRRGESSPA